MTGEPSSGTPKAPCEVDLQANKLAARVAVFLQPVGVNQPGRVIVRRGEDFREKVGGMVGHSVASAFRASNSDCAATRSESDRTIASTGASVSRRTSSMNSARACAADSPKDSVRFNSS